MTDKNPKKPETKADRVRAVMKKHPNKTVPEIAELAGVPTMNVHSTIKQDRRKAGLEPKQQRKKKAKKTAASGLAAKLDALETAWKDIQEAHAFIGDRLKLIDEMIHG